LPLIVLLALAASAVGLVAGWFIARARLSLAANAVRAGELAAPASIASLTAQLAGETDPEKLVRRAVEWLHSNAGVPVVVAYRYEGAISQLIDPVVVGGTLPSLPPRLKLGALVYGQMAADVARNRTLPRLIDPIAREGNFGPVAEGMQVAYLVPLLHDSKFYGVVGAQSDRPNAFREPEQAMLNRFAALVAAQLAIAQQLRDAVEAMGRFDSFQHLAQSLSTQLSTQDLVQQIVEAARQMLETQMSILLDFDDQSGSLTPMAWAGITDEQAALIRTSLKRDLKGLVAWARRPARTPDLRTDQRSALAREAFVAGMLSELAVPVMYFDELYGVLAVETNTHRHFTDEEMNLLNALAAQAGIALRNADLFEVLQATNTQLERANAELIISQQQTEYARQAAVQANRLKTEFINNMSHELRTPLNAVINFTRIVTDAHAGPVNEQQKTFLGYVHDSGQHLLGLINDILDLAKIESGKMELRREPTAIEPILKGVMSTAIGLTRDKGIALRQEIAPDLPTLFIDGTRVRQVLLNVLSNAAKFTEQGTITLRAERNEEDVLVAVQDTGVGIPPDDIHKVFEEFRQVDNPLSTTAGGTGLGMPISRRFVQLHGGRMWIESEPGAGTTVFFTLPLRPPDNAESTDPTRPSAARGNTGPLKAVRADHAAPNGGAGASRPDGVAQTPAQGV
jgi:signal transduction histidine kinase